MPTTKPTLIVVADAGRVRLFSTDNRGASISEVPGGLSSLPEPPAHHHKHEGTVRVHDNIGARRPAMDPNSDPHQKGEDNVARNLAHHLEGLFTDTTYSDIILFAPPTMLGGLRRDLSAGITKKISAESHKDLTKSSVEEIRKHVQEILFPQK